MAGSGGKMGFSSVQWRKLNSKATFNSSLSYFSLKRCNHAQSTRGQPAVNLGSTWGRPGVSLLSPWGQTRVNLGSIWGQPAPSYLRQAVHGEVARVDAGCRRRGGG